MTKKSASRRRQDKSNGEQVQEGAPRTARTADPHASREAARYDNPIASRELIREVLAETRQPLQLEQLAEILEIEPQDEEATEALRRRVKAMLRDGQLVENRRGGLVPVDDRSLVAGRVSAHPDGFGFLIADDGDTDVFLHARQMRQVMHGDRVVVSITGEDRRGRREGRLIEVVERANHSLVGRFNEEKGVLFVVPDNKRIQHDLMIPVAERNGAETGDIVVAEITEQPGRRHPPVGRIVEVLGQHLEAGMEIDVALRNHDIPFEWPDAVLEEAAAYSTEVQDDDKLGRKDVRNIPLVTIDGVDARDFDDAVWCEPTDKGWRLLVAIADVAHYVTPGSALDSEARQRGTSVYFPGRVVPMLPEVLSNGLCSLNPEVDRLCMLCELTIDARGQIKKSRFHNALMRSHARLTYASVWEMLSDQSSELRQQHAALLPDLENLHKLFKLLHAARERRGVIEFSSSETRIVFNDERKIEEILPVVRNDAHRLIEECMITANVAAARFVEQHKVPALFRVHHGPKPDRLEDLRAFLSFRGLTLGGGDAPGPEDYAELSERIADRPDRAIIETTMLRSMQQAVYQPKNEGHFGLALDEYAHFTSPIRRYPDLLLHRAIKYVLSRKPVDQYPLSPAEMQAFGEVCSMSERRADEATRDVVSWLKCEYMQEHVGAEFAGVVASVTSFGLFVELSDIHIEGLVHITNLPRDYYVYEQAAGALVGENSGRSYHLGDQLRVTVAAVNLDERKIDFLPASEPVSVPRVAAATVAGKSDQPRGNRQKTASDRKPSPQGRQQNRSSGKQRELRGEHDTRKQRERSDGSSERAADTGKPPFDRDKSARHRPDAKREPSDRRERSHGRSSADKGRKPAGKRTDGAARSGSSVDSQFDAKPDAVAQSGESRSGQGHRSGGKPFSSAESGGKKFSSKKSGGKKFSSKKSGGRKFSSKDAGDKQFSSAESGGKKFSSKKSGGRKFSSKKSGGRKFSNEESGGSKFSGKKSGGKKSGGKKFSGKKSGGKKFSGKKSSGKKFSGKKSGGKKSGGKKSDNQFSSARSGAKKFSSKQSGSKKRSVKKRGGRDA